MAATAANATLPSKSNNERHMTKGFTLIELSIVLVIIGLIVGGVLVGQDMILSAQIRNAIKQVEQFNTATEAFKSKYNCLPGNCANATDYGFAVNGSGS